MDNSDGQKDFLGGGWRFPVEVNRISGRIEESCFERSIAESIKIILHTSRGERVMRPEFGCDLRKYAFSEMDFGVMSEIENEIKRSLTLWEPRITETEVKCGRGDGAVLLAEISYVVRSTNNPYNLVYPFYLNEGG